MNEAMLKELSRSCRGVLGKGWKTPRKDQKGYQTRNSGFFPQKGNRGGGSLFLSWTAKMIKGIGENNVSCRFRTGILPRPHL